MVKNGNENEIETKLGEIQIFAYSSSDFQKRFK